MPTITFKVSAQEAAHIRRLARREGRTVSEFLRHRAIQSPVAAESHGYHVEKSPVTGLPVMHAPERTPPVTSEQVRALLSDFP